MNEDDDHLSDKSSSSLSKITFLIHSSSLLLDVVQDAPDYTPTVNETYSSFVCAVFSVWTIIFSDEHDNHKTTLEVEIPNPIREGV